MEDTNKKRVETLLNESSVWADDSDSQNFSEETDSNERDQWCRDEQSDDEGAHQDASKCYVNLYELNNNLSSLLVIWFEMPLKNKGL